MDWQAHLDNYCERVSSTFWAEPANALSNLAFLLAAFLVWRTLRRTSTPAPASLTVLVVLMTMIGLGSFLFHTMATAWSQLFDVVPIGIFVCCYIACYLHWFWRWPWAKAWIGVLAFGGICGVTVAVFGSRAANGSLPYLPVLLTLIGFTVALKTSSDPGRAVHWRTFAAASAILTAALVFRTIDLTICDGFPLGTHFLWHLLNGIQFFLLSRAMVGRWQQLTTH